MKRKLLVITLVMMFFAVQGYAQRQARERGSSRTEYRQERRHSTYDRSQRNAYRNNSRPEQGYRHQSPAPRYEPRNYRPRQPVPRYEPRHYRPHPPVYRYHHHHCLFNDWYWYSWRGYHNRFIAHRLYHNRFFDNRLGYYLWGTLEQPTRLDIGSMTLTRYNGTLKIQIGYEYAYMDLYTTESVRYEIGYTTVDIRTGQGHAFIRFYDEYGNEASYTL